MYTEIRSTQDGVTQYRLVLTFTPFTLTMALTLIALAAVFAYSVWRRSILDTGNKVGRLPCMIFVSLQFIHDTRLTLFHPVMGYNSA